MSWLACVQRLGRTVLLLRPGAAFLPHRDIVAAQSRNLPSFRGKGAAFAPEQAHDEGPGSSIVHSVQQVALLLLSGSAWVPAIIDANSGDVASSKIVRLHAMHASQSDHLLHPQTCHMMVTLPARHSGLPCLLLITAPGCVSRKGHTLTSGMSDMPLGILSNGLVACNNITLSTSCFVLRLSILNLR